MNEEETYYRNESVIEKFIEYKRKYGIFKSLKKVYLFIRDKFVSLFLNFKKQEYFYFNNKLPYFYHKYNKAWKSERTIEIPIFRMFIKENIGKDLLEIGNVINHYYPFNHLVLDKYEKAEGVINEDILGFKTKKKFDFIFSISTFEHIGIDDYPKNPEKAVLALKYVLKNLLKKNGLFVLSFPLNYNKAIKEMIDKKRIKNFKMYCFKKIDMKRNFWKEADYPEIRNIEYKQPVEEVIFLILNKNTTIK